MVIISFEKAFLLLLIQQDATSFNIFYLKTVDVFFRYLQNNYYLSYAEAEDIIADFYVKFWPAVAKYDIEKSFSAYVWTIFKNNLKDAFKKNKELPFSSLTRNNEEGFEFEDSLVEESTMEELLQQDFELAQIQQAMRELDEISREIIYLKYIEHKTNPEIQDMLAISSDVLRQRISRAIKKLKTLLSE